MNSLRDSHAFSHFPTFSCPRRYTDRPHSTIDPQTTCYSDGVLLVGASASVKTPGPVKKAWNLLDDHKCLLRPSSFGHSQNRECERPSLMCAARLSRGRIGYRPSERPGGFDRCPRDHERPHSDSRRFGWGGGRRPIELLSSRAGERREVREGT